MTHSIRTRLLAGIICGMIILLALFSGIIYTAISHALTREFDRSLTSSIRMLSAAVEHEQQEDESDEDDSKQDEDEEHGELEFEIDINMIPEFNRVSGAGYYQIQHQDGRIIVRSPSLKEDESLPVPDLSMMPVVKKLRLPNGSPGRMTGLWFVPRGKGATEEFMAAKDNQQLIGIVLARDAGRIHEQLSFLMWLLFCASGAVILLTFVAARTIVATGLSPLQSISREIADIKIDILDTRLTTEHIPAEILPVVNRLNDMLGRLEESFARERQFNADVAHELRTPLAGLQSTIEVAMLKDRQPEEYRTALARCLDISNSMNEMVETLLKITRLDSGQITIEKQEINLKQLVDDAWSNFTKRSAAKNLSFQNKVVDQLSIITNRTHLAMIVSNILDNAVEYSDDDGHVTVETIQTPDDLKLSVSNTGCTLNQDEADKVFDFFWRKDPSRTDTGKHIGVGLSVVRKIAKLLDIKVTTHVQEGVFIIDILLESDLKSCT